MTERSPAADTADTTSSRSPRGGRGRRHARWTGAAGARWTGAARAALPALLTLLLLPLAAPLLPAQERAGAGRDRDRAEPVDRPLVQAPHQFRVGPAGGVLTWDQKSGQIDDAGLFGVDLESVVARYLGFRIAGGVGTTTLTRGEQVTDAIQYVAEALVEGRLAVDPLQRTGVVPFVAVGGGSVIHDPSASELITRSQSAFVWGAGVDVVGFADRFGFRVEWRRVTADLQNIFDPANLEGTTRDADRFAGSLYWVF